MRRTGDLADARRLAESFTADWLERHGMAAVAPVDIHGLVRRFGLPVVESKIDQDGRLRPGSPPTILVQSGQSRPRERFTIAHELAHWAVWSGEAASVGLNTAFLSEEVLCDTVAGALLMPQPWVWSCFPAAARTQNLETLRELAKRADVSLGAAVIRMRDVFGWRKTLLHWSRVEGEWVFDGEAGVYPSQQGAIIPSANVAFMLNEVRNNGRGIQHCALPLRVFQDERDVAAEVLPLRKGAAVLVDAPGRVSDA